MRINFLAVGNRPPPWAEAAFRDYAARLPPALKLDSAMVRLARGHAKYAAGAAMAEGKKLLSLLDGRDHVVALREHGECWSTTELAGRLRAWESAGKDVAVIAGGPDGLSSACIERADELWSLSRLTLPHALVRVIVSEQLYRAWTVNAGHPYHRA